MRRKQFFFIPLITILLFFSGVSSAQVWSGVLSPSRAIDWSNAGVTGGIQNRTTICATLNPGSTVSQINSAINNCSNGVVQLNAGTYNLTSGIQLKSNVTLRGAGANQTKLNFTGFSNGLGGSGTYAIGVEGNYSAQWWDQAPGPFGANPSNIKSWVGTNGKTGVYTKGATVLNLASAPTGSPNLSVGDMLFLVQDDDSSPLSTVFISAASGVSREGSANTRGTGQRQAVKVTAISGTQVTISPGIYMDNYRTSQDPQVYWWGGDIRGAGVEDLFIESGSNAHYTNISFFQASDSWVRGVASHETGSRNHVNVFLSRNVTVQDSFFYQSCAGGCNGSATGYGVELFAPTATLVLNNILINIESPFLFSVGGAGNVIAYNYESGGATGIASHEEGFLMNLYEGNDTNLIRSDTFHGNQNFTTIFRNHVGNNGQASIDTWAYNRYFNIVGNVLGSAGDNRYDCLAPDTAAQCSRYATPSIIYRLGFAGANAGAGPEAGVSADPLVAATTLRWGNYDVVTKTSRFVASEIPSVLTTYANLVPSSQSLPASFFLSAKPGWWPSSKPWPAIGPEVTGGNVANVGGHAYTIPANDCYSSVGGNIASFNADNCYGGQVSSSPPPSGGPTPPSGLNAIVQ